MLGQTQIRFSIMRDGRISDVSVEKSSGYFALDQAAERALLVTRQLPPLPSQYTESAVDRSPRLPLRALMTFFRSSRTVLLLLALAGAGTVVRSQQPAPPAPPPPQQQSDVGIEITNESGQPPKYAVPDFVAASSDADTHAATKIVGEVLVERFGLRARVLFDPARHLRRRFRRRNRLPTCRSIAGRSSAPTVW